MNNDAQEQSHKAVNQERVRIVVKDMVSINIIKQSILDMNVDCVVNAANSQLARGGGICGVIFAAADADALALECKAIGHCPTGSAVITDSCGLKARYIIHAVGPVWQGGSHNEPAQLYGCYTKALEIAAQNDIHSIAFPLISSGIFGYPKDKAWRVALQACLDFKNKIDSNACSDSEKPTYNLDIVIGVLSDSELNQGNEILKKLLVMQK